MVVENFIFDESEDGQSVVEFLLLLPMLVGMTLILIKTNTAIQISIINQQYSRAHTLFITFNNPFYPLINRQNEFAENSMNQIVIGVSNQSLSEDATTYNPKATVQSISRSKKVAGSNATGEEPSLRSDVRVRNTVTLCTQTLYVKSGGKTAPLNSYVGSGYDLNLALNNLHDSTSFSTLCGGAIPYEQ
jgi:hypothetical protein